MFKQLKISHAKQITISPEGDVYVDNGHAIIKHDGIAKGICDISSDITLGAQRFFKIFEGYKGDVKIIDDGIEMDNMLFHHKREDRNLKWKDDFGKVVAKIATEDVMAVYYATKNGDSARERIYGVAINDGHVVATDGHKMAFREIKGCHGNVLIPNSIISTLGKGNSTLAVCINGKVITVKTEDKTYQAIGTDMDYPLWRRAIPENIIGTFTIPVDLKQKIKKLIKGNPGEIAMRIGKNRLALGDDCINEVIKTEGIESDNFIKLNPQYLVEILHKDMVFAYQDGATPIISYGETNHILMPCR